MRLASPRTLIAAAAALLGTLGASTTGWAQSKPLVVGGKNFTEQLLLAEMTTELLKAKGLMAEKKDGLASALLRQAQESYTSRQGDSDQQEATRTGWYPPRTLAVR